MWVVGVLLNVVGATCTNLGTVLMKYHSQMRQNIGPWKKAGGLLFVIGTVLTFLSFAYAAQSLLAGVSAVQFVTNLIFAHFLLKESFNRYNISGTAVIVAGIVLLVFSSVKSAPSVDVDTFFSKFYFSTTHFVYIICISSIFFLMSFLFWFRTGILPFWLLKSAKPEARLIFELNQSRSQTRLSRIGIPLIYVCLSAMIGAQSVVSGKIISVVLTQDILKGDLEALSKFPIYLALATWVSVAIFWVVHLARAMQFFPGAFVITLTQVFWTFWSMVSGGIVFDEFVALSDEKMALLSLGMLTIFGGVFIVYRGAPRPPGQTTLSRHGSPQTQNATSRLRSLMISMSMDGFATSTMEGFTEEESETLSDVEPIAEDVPLDPPYLRLYRYLSKIKPIPPQMLI